MDKCTFTVNDNMIIVNGLLDGSSTDELAALMGTDFAYILDFAGMSGINFAGLRSLINAKKAGKRFCVINAEDSVAEKFEDTGLSCLVSVCRKLKPLDTTKYDEFGGGFISKSLNSADGDSVLKIYDKKMPAWFAAQEKSVARQVMLFGIPTPLVGTLYACEEGTGLDYERIEGKRSLSRIISQEPERLEEVSRKFAQMCKELHSTPCDTETFPNRADGYRRDVMACKEISDETKSRAMAFIDSLPEETTCLHGDMQPSNIITNGKEYLWIDLAEFGYGYHMLDLGMWYFLAKMNPEELCQHIFHLSKETISLVWDVFADEYFGAKTPEQKADVENEVRKFAALHAIHLGGQYHFFPWMIEFINKEFK